MRLHSLSLTNIRSYTKADLTFPKGNILLWGDVGSGKTTILLSIEFALFGILRGELSAASLLRHGTTEGVVELQFSVDGETHTITRTLKRDNKSVKQGAGKLDDQPLTPVELRAHILDILGYPEELLTKGKADVYRYTVYTPQEEMKRILLDSPQLRLETLRSIFGIDHYQKIKENTALLTKELRAEGRALKLQLEELPHKAKQLEEVEKQLEETKKELDAHTNNAQHTTTLLQTSTQQLEKAQHATKNYQEATTKLTVTTLRTKELTARKERLVEQQTQLKKHLLEQPPTIIIPKEPTEQLQKAKTQLATINERLEKARNTLTTITTKQETKQENKTKLKGLGASCPLCEQSVPHDHTTKLTATIDEELSALEEKEKEVTLFIQKATTKQQEVQEHLEKLRVQQTLCATRKAQREAQEKERTLLHKQLTELEEEQKENQTQLALAQKEQQAQETHLATLKDTQKELQDAQQHHKQAQEKHHQAQLELTKHKERKTQLSIQQQRLKEEFTRLKTQQTRTQQLSTTTKWLADAFTPATTTIEQTVFASLHVAFDASFRNWFDKLIEDETLQVYLDEHFTPLIELNGYDTSIEALSGGERTAVALAYRLALTHVINEFVGTLKTRDLLILDEPTDGFSQHQLSRLKDVFDELGLQQLIIVSHETALEGFADHLITISKQEQTSQIATD